MKNYKRSENTGPLLVKQNWEHISIGNRMNASVHVFRDLWARVMF